MYGSCFFNAPAATMSQHGLIIVISLVQVHINMCKWMMSRNEFGLILGGLPLSGLPMTTSMKTVAFPSESWPLYCHKAFYCIFPTVNTGGTWDPVQALNRIGPIYVPELGQLCAHYGKWHINWFNFLLYRGDHQQGNSMVVKVSYPPLHS